MRSRFFIIHNPIAAPPARVLFRDTLAALRRAGASAEIVDTDRHGDATRAATDAARNERFHAIIAAGGDGTAHHVAAGLLGYAAPLGIIPMGTANVLAREINLPQSSEHLAWLLIHGQVRPIPVGQVNGKPFLSVIGVGFDADAVRLFEEESTRMLGQAGFIWPMLRALPLDRDRPLRVTTLRGEAEAQWVIVTRIKHYAGNLLIAPDADLHQPGFVVVRMKGEGPLIRLRQLAAVALGLARYDPDISLERTNWVRIEGRRTIPVQIDGEVFGELPLDITVHPQRLHLISPNTESIT